MGSEMCIRDSSTTPNLKTFRCNLQINDCNKLQEGVIRCEGPPRGGPCQFKATRSERCEYAGAWGGCDPEHLATAHAMIKRRAGPGIIEHYCQRCIRRPDIATKQGLNAYSAEHLMGWPRGTQTTEEWLKGLICGPCFKHAKEARQRLTEAKLGNVEDAIAIRATAAQFDCMNRSAAPASSDASGPPEGPRGAYVWDPGHQYWRCRVCNGGGGKGTLATEDHLKCDKHLKRIWDEWYLNQSTVPMVL